MHSLDFAWSVPWCDLPADMDIMVSVQTGKLLQLHMLNHHMDNSFTRQGLVCSTLPTVDRQHQKATHIYMLLSCQPSIAACLLTGGRCTSVHMVFVLYDLCVHPS